MIRSSLHSADSAIGTCRIKDVTTMIIYTFSVPCIYCMYGVRSLGYQAVILAVLGSMMVFCVGVTAAGTDWTNVTTKGNYSFMVPPGWSYTVVNTPSGEAETIINPDNLNATYVISLTDTQVEEGTAEAAAKIGLGAFMKSENLSPVKDYEVTYSEEDGVATVICTDPKGTFYSVVFYPVDNKSILLMGLYPNEDSAKEEIGTLVEIVQTVILNA